MDIRILNQNEWPKNPDSTPNNSKCSILYTVNTSCEVRTACLSSGLKRSGQKADHSWPPDATLPIPGVVLNHRHHSTVLFTKTRTLLPPFLKQKPRTLASEQSAEKLDRLYIEINNVQRTELTSYAVRVCVLLNI
jgi:hypothetical protein